MIRTYPHITQNRNTFLVAGAFIFHLYNKQFLHVEFHKLKYKELNNRYQIKKLYSFTFSWLLCCCQPITQKYIFLNSYSASMSVFWKIANFPLRLLSERSNIFTNQLNDSFCNQYYFATTTLVIINYTFMGKISLFHYICRCRNYWFQCTRF